MKLAVLRPLVCACASLLALSSCKRAPETDHGSASNDDLLTLALTEAGCWSTVREGTVVQMTCGDGGVTGSIDTANLDARLSRLADGDARLALVRRFVATAVGSARSGGSSEERDVLPRSALRPALKPRAVVEATIARVPPEKRDGFGIPSHALCGDVVVLMVVDKPDSMDLVTSQSLESWKTTPAELFPLALANLAAAPSPSPHPQTVDGASLAVLPGDDEYNAVRVLLPETQKAFAALLGGPVAFAIPTRDRLLGARADDRGALQVLRREAARAFAAGPYGITGDLVQPDATGGFHVL
jgi:hypothetical protein